MENIEDFFKKYAEDGSLRLEYRDRWMVYNKTKLGDEWVIYEKKYGKRVKLIGQYELLSDALYFLKDQI